MCCCRALSTSCMSLLCFCSGVCSCAEGLHHNLVHCTSGESLVDGDTLLQAFIFARVAGEDPQYWTIADIQCHHVCENTQRFINNLLVATSPNWKNQLGLLECLRLTENDTIKSNSETDIIGIMMTVNSQSETWFITFNILNDFININFFPDFPQKDESLTDHFC